MTDPGIAMLRAFHRKYAGGATAAFGPGDCGDGRSSYEHLLDALPGSQLLDALPGSHLLDAVPGSHLLDALPGSQLLDALPGSQLLDALPGSQLLDALPPGHAHDALPGSHLTAALPPGHAHDALPPGHAALPSPPRVLDAGCGDGFLLERLAARSDASLIGVDMSPEELALARVRLPNAVLLEARLDAVPLPDGSVDAVVSHMVLMLITELEPVIDELARLLRPGGALIAVVGSELGGPPTHKRVVEHLWRTMDAEVGPPPSLGDPRCRSVEGLRALFAGPAWGPIACDDLVTEVRMPLSEATAYIQQAWYGLERLPEATWPAFAEWLASQGDDVAPYGIFTWTMNLRRVVVPRTGERCKPG